MPRERVQDAILRTAAASGLREGSIRYWLSAGMLPLLIRKKDQLAFFFDTKWISLTLNAYAKGLETLRWCPMGVSIRRFIVPSFRVALLCILGANLRKAFAM